MKQPLRIPEKLVPVFTGPAMYRGAYGGRGSAKTRTFALMTAVWAYRWARRGVTGTIVCGREFMNSLDDSSMAEVQAAISETPWLAEHFALTEKTIRTKDGLVDYSFIGLRRQLASLKSKARILLLWVDEAETISDLSWTIADNTVRDEGAEVWATWNPARNSRKEKDGSLVGSATDWRWRKSPPPHSKIVQMNWRDNPFFPQTLEIKRQNDLSQRPEQYDHIWEGDYVETQAGAYYAAGLSLAKREGRIGFVRPERTLPIRVYCDLGGTSRQADAFVMLVVQFVGNEIRILDHYEAIGQEPEEHLGWLAERWGSWNKTQVIIRLPHDGSTQSGPSSHTWERVFKEAGYNVPPMMPNRGAGVARRRIDRVRELFPHFRINEATTEGWRGAMGWYHERVDDVRGTGLGPDHDWSSHTADATGEMAFDYEPPRNQTLDPATLRKMREYQQALNDSIV